MKTSLWKKENQYKYTYETRSGKPTYKNGRVTKCACRVFISSKLSCATRIFQKYYYSNQIMAPYANDVSKSRVTCFFFVVWQQRKEKKTVLEKCTRRTKLNYAFNSFIDVWPLISIKTATVRWSRKVLPCVAATRSTGGHRKCRYVQTN